MALQTTSVHGNCARTKCYGLLQTTPGREMRYMPPVTTAVVYTWCWVTRFCEGY